MAITINTKKCDNCEHCIKVCPFGAIDAEGNGDFDVDGGGEGKRLIINAACKNCGLCIKACEKNAIVLIDDMREKINKDEWRGILVFAELDRGKLHPVVRELVGMALILAGEKRSSEEKLADKDGRVPEEKKDTERHSSEVSAVIIGNDVTDPAQELLSFGADTVYIYEHELRNK